MVPSSGQEFEFKFVHRIVKRALGSFNDRACRGNRGKRDDLPLELMFLSWGSIFCKIDLFIKIKISLQYWSIFHPNLMTDRRKWYYHVACHPMWWRVMMQNLKIRWARIEIDRGLLPSIWCKWALSSKCVSGMETAPALLSDSEHVCPWPRNFIRVFHFQGYIYLVDRL